MVIEEIKWVLLSVRQAGAALDVHQICGVIVVQIQHNQPEIFKTVAKSDGHYNVQHMPPRRPQLMPIISFMPHSSIKPTLFAIMQFPVTFESTPIKHKSCTSKAQTQL